MDLCEIVQDLCALSAAHTMVCAIAPDKAVYAGECLARDIVKLARLIEADMVNERVQADERERYAPSATNEPIPAGEPSVGPLELHMKPARYAWSENGGIVERSDNEPVNAIVTDEPDVSTLTPADVENVAAMLGEFFGAVDAPDMQPDPAA